RITGNAPRLDFFGTNANAGERNWALRSSQFVFGDFNVFQSNAKDGDPRFCRDSPFLHKERRQRWYRDHESRRKAGCERLDLPTRYSTLCGLCFRTELQSRVNRRSRPSCGTTGTCRLLEPKRLMSMARRSSRSAHECVACSKSLKRLTFTFQHST